MKTVVQFFEDDPVDVVWEHYSKLHPRARFSKGDRKRIMDRFAEGYSVGELMLAIDGNHLDPFCNGENDRGKQYHKLDLILRDSGRVADFIETAQSPPNGPPSKSVAGRMLARAAKQKEVGDDGGGVKRLDR